LLRDSIRFGLCPDRVLFARYGRGLRPELLKKGSFPVSAGAPDEPWRGALGALPRILKDEVPRAAGASILLSGHFVRHLVLGANDSLSCREEWREYASHQFERIHGARARDWNVQVAESLAAHPRLASAIDKALIEAALAAFEGSRARLESIQPYLVAAFNRALPAMHGPSSWFALQEPGRLQLGFVRDGVWQSIRSRQVNGRWHEELPELVERESALLAASDSCGEVLVYSLGPEEPAATGAFKITAALANLPADERLYAMVCA
jgi:hypothetical protein